MKIRIRKKNQSQESQTTILEARVNVELGDIMEDKVVALLKRWRKFVNSLSNEQKATVRRWACGDNDGCTPETINRWSKALKGSLD
jgi:hypothetical protein